jgi:hypothetical protein
VLGALTLTVGSTDLMEMGNFSDRRGLEYEEVVPQCQGSSATLLNDLQSCNGVPVDRLGRVPYGYSSERKN